MQARMRDVQAYRRDTQDAYYFNWVIAVDEELQRPFKPTHANMTQLNLHKTKSPTVWQRSYARRFPVLWMAMLKTVALKL